MFEEAEEGAGVLPANNGGNWSKVKASATLTQLSEEQEVLKCILDSQ